MDHGVAFWILFVAVFLLLVSVAAVKIRLGQVEKKLDRVLANFDGLRVYLYEIDPQFDDERYAKEAMADGSNVSGAYEHFRVHKQKSSEHRRTLDTQFYKQDET